MDAIQREPLYRWPWRVVRCVQLQEGAQQIAHPVERLVVGLGGMAPEDALVVQFRHCLARDFVGEHSVLDLSCQFVNSQEKRNRLAVIAGIGAP